MGDLRTDFDEIEDGGREVIQAWAAPNGSDPVTMKRRLAELVES